MLQARCQALELHPEHSPLGKRLLWPFHRSGKLRLRLSHSYEVGRAEAKIHTLCDELFLSHSLLVTNSLVNGGDCPALLIRRRVQEGGVVGTASTLHSVPVRK